MKPLILIAGTMDVHRRYYELVQKSGMNAQMLSYRAGEAFPYSTTVRCKTFRLICSFCPAAATLIPPFMEKQPQAQSRPTVCWI